MINIIGEKVITFDCHKGIVIKQYCVTGSGVYIQIKQENGNIWYCPITDIFSII